MKKSNLEGEAASKKARVSKYVLELCVSAHLGFLDGKYMATGQSNTNTHLCFFRCLAQELNNQVETKSGKANPVFQWKAWNFETSHWLRETESNGNISTLYLSSCTAK